MNKLTLLKKLGLGAATALSTAVPLSLTTSCGNNANGIQTTFVSAVNLHDSSLEKVEYQSIDKDEILLGSRRFFNGNYFLFVGSNIFPSTGTFFTGDVSGNPPVDVETWKNDFFESSFLYTDAKRAVGSNKVKTDFGFVAYIDDFDLKFYDNNNHEICICKDASKDWDIIQKVGPFDKWKPEYITQTKQFMDKLKQDGGRLPDGTLVDYEWDDESVTVDDYIRQDQKAKDYRAFCERGLSFFPTTDDRKITFDTSNDSKKSLMLIYKDGRLQEIVDLPAAASPATEAEDYKETTTLFGAINKHFWIEEEDDPK